MKTYSRLKNIDKLISGNDYFVSHAKKEEYEELAKGQNPFALVIACSDSRVIPEHIFNVPAGSLLLLELQEMLLMKVNLLVLSMD